MQRPTVHDLTSDDNHFAQLARRTWLTAKPAKVLPSIVRDELYDKLEAESFPQPQLALLEQLQCLERYLWPGYADDASNQHILLILLLVNVKRQANLPIWSLFEASPDAFSSFFKRVLHMSIDASLPISVRQHVLVFIITALQSLDSGVVRRECAPLVSVAIWTNLHSESERERKLAGNVALQKAWRAAGKKYSNADDEGQARIRFERSWLYTLVLDFLTRLYGVEGNADQRQTNVRYCERSLELLCDLLSQLPTKRYVNALLQDLNVLAAIKLSPRYQDEDSSLLRELHEILAHYIGFPIDDQSGKQLSRQEYEELSNAGIARLQRAALQLHPEKLKILILANYGLLSQRTELQSHLADLSDSELLKLVSELGLRSRYPEKSSVITDRTFLLEVVVTALEAKPYYIDAVRDMTTMPTERVLYDKALLRTDDFDGTMPLAIPKLNLQYLTAGDFLWRSFILYRAEAFYEIRKHLEDTVKRLQPRRQASGITTFDGFSSMAIPITKPAIIETLPPRVGEDVPAEVKAEVMLDVSRLQPKLRQEWESVRPDDVVFLLHVQAQDRALTNGNASDLTPINEKLGLKAVRSAEIISVLDEAGRMLRRDGPPGHDSSRPRQRRLLLRLDAASYKQDQADSKAEPMDGINLIIRRRARENTFKAVLDSVKNLAVSDAPLPPWFQDVFLGYGDPATVTAARLTDKTKAVDYRDTFLDWQHLIESFPGQPVEPDGNADGSFPPPYVLESTTAAPAAPPRTAKKRKREAEAEPVAQDVQAIKVSTYGPPNAGPYPTDAPKVNKVRFTPAQVKAVSSGTKPGLTLVVGPPGTGKTDVATQIISNIYHNYPEQRTLLVAHSNQALNQLFQKITALNIDERHLLRLGHGEEELTTEASYSKAGRVESFLERGSQHLAEVQRLANSINAPGAHGSTCETATYFDQVYATPMWKRFWTAAEGLTSAEDVSSIFPFHVFFADASQPLFPANTPHASLLDIARGCETHIRHIFTELASIRPFELLRSPRDKANYLLIKEARIIAMTSTHAAMRRQEIASLGFQYDTVVMEEAAQLTEIETLIPFALQNPTPGKTPTSRLKRIVLVGDHLQNAPIIQNAAFRQYANLEQSLFLRLVRLGVPICMLDAQGRARPSLAALYKWRYPSLTNLPITTTSPEFQRANAGLRYDYQFIDVPAYRGVGESEPSPHFIQNLGEAEYVVAMFQYLRLLGYPAHRISILTTYAGQRALIRDVLGHRCKGKAMFGMPGWVGTVDKYQGEENDFVLLSLVRTKTVGYLRDLRRLTVALSRARLGLYVFGRREVFESSLEVRQAFSLLFARPEKLTLVVNELHPTQRGVEDEVEGTEMEGLEHLGSYIPVMVKAKLEQIKQEGGQIVAEDSGGRMEDEEDEEGGEALAEDVAEMEGIEEDEVV
nr:hypothetical protein B0A51_06213 [Rachicladosporium sp. CCFEE 5018]